MPIDSIPNLEPQFVDATLIAQSEEGRSALFLRDLARLQVDLTHVKSKSFSFDKDKDSKLVLFLQNGFDALKNEKPSGNNGRADDAFLSEMRAYVASKNVTTGDSASGQLPEVRKLSDINGQHISAIITDLRVLRGEGRLSSNPQSVQAFAEALLEIKDKDVQERATKFLEKLGPKGDKAEQGVPGTKLVYNTTTNTLTI